MVNQSGWTHEERNLACKKMGSLKEHCDICPYRENLRTSHRAAMMCSLEEEEEGMEAVSKCTAALISASLTVPMGLPGVLTLSDSVSSPTHLYFPFLVETQTEGQCPFSEYLPAVRGRSRFFLAELLFR